MDFLDRLNNVYVIDTKMWDFDHYMSAYLVEGEELALIDTGQPKHLGDVGAGIKAHGLSVSDISYIFVTHEHADHAGNAAPLLRESPKAKVYINPAALDFLTEPSADIAMKRKQDTPEWAARRADMEPVPQSRIEFLKNGDIFDLGNSEKLRIIFAPGHQPGGIAIFEEKNSGLFINDLVGNCFPDADAHYPLHPPRSDDIKAIESLQKLLGLPVKNLYMGHYGISDKPIQVMTRAINNMQQLLDMGITCIRESKPELIASKMMEMLLPELEKLRSARGEALYQYAVGNHQRKQVQEFANFCQQRFK